MGLRTGIGLDINDAGICAVELRATSKGMKILRTGRAPTPRGSVRDGTIVDPGAVARTVKQLLRSSRIRPKGKRTAAALSGPSYVARVTQLPEGGPAAIREHVRQEVKRYVVFARAQAVSDFAVLKLSHSKDKARRALVAAAKESAAADLVKVLMKAGMEPDAIDVSSLAAARAVISRCQGSKPHEAVVLAVVEPTMIRLLVVQGKAVCFSHTGTDPLEVFEDGAASARHLAERIQPVLNFYEAEIGSRRDVGKILVCAGQDLPEEFETTLSSALEGLAVEICSPSSLIEDEGLIADEVTVPPTACAVGLGMRAVGDLSFPVNVNLIPESVGQVRALKKRSLVTATMAFFLLLASLSTVGVIHRNQLDLEAEMQHLQRNLGGFAKPDEARALQDEIDHLSRIVEKERAFLELGVPVVSWEEMLSFIKLIIPEDVRLTSLETGRSKDVLFEGEALSVDSVYKFVEPLANSEFFISAKLTRLDSAYDDEGGLLKYTIKCQLKCQAEKRSD